MTNPILLFILLAALSCTSPENQRSTGKPNQIVEVALVEIVSFSFRRNYHGHEKLQGEEKKRFMNRNPEPSSNYYGKHVYVDALVKKGLIANGNLNINEIDTLQDQFSFRISQSKNLAVEKKYIDDPKQVSAPSFVLRFHYDKHLLAIDTLTFIGHRTSLL